MKSKQQASRPAGFMVESTLMLKEGDELISSKEAMTVAKVNVVTHSYKESSKESGSSGELS